MEQFNLEKWLQDKSRKVVTREGRPVRIVCWDNTPTMPVIAVGRGGNPWSTDKYGYYKHNHEVSGFDLFFADEEELTEFESKLADLLVYNHPMDIESANSIAKRKSKTLLDLARKELQPEFEAELDKAYKYVDKVQYENGKKDALKDLPKWIPNKFEKRNWETCKAYLDTPCYLVHDDWMISVEELEKLPKEE